MAGESVIVEILTGIPCSDLGAARERLVEDVIDPETELKVSLLSSDDLIASKRGSGRPQDLADVHAIRQRG
jgi:hypothetical protein